MAACDPPAKPPDPLQQLWALILRTNPYLKQAAGQAAPSMKLKLDEATSDTLNDDREQATPGWKPRLWPRTCPVIKKKEKQKK